LLEQNSNKDADLKNLINSDTDQENDADRLQILTIKVCLRDSLLSIASKLLSSEQITLDQLFKKNNACGTHMTMRTFTNS